MSYLRLTLREKAGLAAVVAWVVFTLLMIAGWIMNLAAIIPLLDGDFTPLLIVRIVGVILFPLGAVLGWF